MISPALEQIIAHDREHGTDYVRTLRAFLNHMGRLPQAAKELNVHRNTLEYLIARIGEVAAVDVTDPDTRLALELGLRVLQLEGKLS